MKIMAFSDLHLSRVRAGDLVAESAKADLIIGAGDFCNARRGLDDAFALLSGLAAPLVAIPGNAESVEELTAAAPPAVTVLHGSETVIGGTRLFGLGYAVPPTPFGGWSCDLPESDAAALLGKCEAADILVVHAPPKGVCDVSSTGASLGSVAIREAIERIQPRLVLCGHIHDSWGAHGTIGASEIFNLGPVPNWFDIDD